MEIPEYLAGRNFRILHIHSENDIEYINESNIEIKDGYVYAKVNRLSEFAFVHLKDNEEINHKGFCLGWLVVIFAVLFEAFFAVYTLLKRKKLLRIIGLGVSGAVFVFALIVLILHICYVSIVGFVLAVLLFAASLVIFFMDKVKCLINKVLVRLGIKEEAPVEEQEKMSDFIAAGESANVGFYRITKDDEGKCTFTLYYEEGDKLSKEMGVFESENAAHLAIKQLRKMAVGAKAENRVKGAESIPAPKFVLDVDAKGVYRYSFIDEEGTVLLQSVSYLNEKRCLEDLKKTLIAVATEEVFLENGELKEDVIEAVEDAPVEVVAEEVAATEIAEEAVEEAKEEVPAEEGVSLKENIAVARATTSHSAVNKQYVVLLFLSFMVLFTHMFGKKPPAPVV